jgi:peptidoglycan hydrolase-like protein with peptidoglycan-binding domain
MKTWTTALALIAASTMLVGSALAQATAPAGDQSKDKAKTDMKAPDATKPDAKSDTMKSEGMKSDGMKSAKHGKGKGDMAQGGNADQVRAVQQALKDKGHDPGEIDGKMGPKTQAALRDYQSKEGLKATGRLDAETMTKLGVEAKTGAAGAASTPSASPKTDSKADSKADTKADSKAESSTGAAAPSAGSSTAPQPGATDTKTDEKK